jgi:NADH-quinone oxidoreductase subunit F
MKIHPLLPELIELQRKDRYLRPEALLDLSRKLNISVNRIYSVASFYQAFRFAPCGKHDIKVCVGAACYVKGAETLYDAFAKYLKLPEDSDTSPDGLFTLSKVACLGCCMLAVAVQIDRHIFGHVKPEDIPMVLKDFLRMAAEDGQEPFEQDVQENACPEIRICRCSSCRAAGSGDVYKAFRAEKGTNNFDFIVKEVSCHGMSYRAPLITVACDGTYYHYDRVRPHDVKLIIAEHFTPKNRLSRATWKGRVFFDAFYRRNKGCCNVEITESEKTIEQARLITRNSGITHPESIDDYRGHGGFTAFEKALNMSPESIISLLEKSKLRGRGGGGFPTGEKWKLAFKAQGESKIVICNADEGDPGAFMDRMLLESYPYRVLEGILIASHVLNADYAIVYIREEYTQAITVLETVIKYLREYGFLKKIKPDYDLVLFKGAGAFVCGEETALLESIEGKRGIPRRRPPFPVTNGLGALPTLINNVETFACIPMILADDGTAFNAVGTEKSYGTKAFALAGKIKKGGLIEVPIGISIRDIVEKFGGGAEDGHTLKAVMIGGPSGGCISCKNFDLPVDYETLQKKGAMMGSGGLIVLDERDCMVDLSLYFLRFLKDESCGKCVMCREGIIRLCAWVEQLTQGGERDSGLLDKIELLARHIQQGSLCALGRTAPNMVLSALHEFRDEFETHLQGCCPAGKCVELTEFQVSDDCIGCTKCAQVCAAGAIECVPLERALINQEKCVKCGVCRTVCPANAIQNVSGTSFKKTYTKAEPEDIELLMPEYRRAVSGKDVIEVNGVEYPFIQGRTLLDYAAEHGWSIPTLCYSKGENESAHCMVCAAWDVSLGRFIPSCEQLIQKGHVYYTDGEQVRDFRREALSLMLARHDFKCGSCSAKGHCGFFDLLREYRVKKEKDTMDYPEKIVTKNVQFDTGKCILCHRCIGVSQGHLTIHNRSGRSCVSPVPESWNDIPESVAKELETACPTGALSTRKDK